MKIHLFKRLWILSPIVSLLACGGSTDNPTTVNRDELQAPLNVYTVTGDEKIEVRWTAGNFEGDLKGYYVFATKTPLADLKKLVAFPSKDVDIAVSGVPRCEDNTKFFEAFGLPAAESDCKGDRSTEEKTSFSDWQGLQDEAAGTKSEEKDKLANFLECAEKPGQTPSLPASAPVSGFQSCTITKAYDPATSELRAIANGEVISIIVVSVMGGDLDDVSWPGNTVEDAASKEALNETITLKTKEFVTLDFSFNSDGFQSLSASANALCDDSKGYCRISKQNANTDPTKRLSLFMGRDYGANHQQRIHLSAQPQSGTGDGIKILARGPQNYDSDKKVSTPRAPGDEPSTDTTLYTADGTTQVIYGNQVFDLLISSGGKQYYAKLVINTVDYASGTKESDSTISVTAIVQPSAGVAHYFAD
jgi:hypothetical protein